MEQIKRLYRYVAKTVKFYTGNRFSTIAGTLVYFLLLSIAPLMLWLTLVIGDFDLHAILPDNIFENISPLIDFLKKNAEGVASGAGVIFLLTSLYSSTNFFYHLRRSGEIIYESSKVKGGIKLRIISALLIFSVIFLIAFISAFSIIGSKFLELFMPPLPIEIMSLIFTVLGAFGIAVLLNLFACPYKMKISQVLTGSLLTLLIWLILIVALGIYAQVVNLERLYGKLASLILFLLWWYMMMCGFVIGMIENSSYNFKREHKTLL